MAGYIGSKASVVSSGAERKKTFAISTTTTSLTGLSYTPTYVHVFHNGVRLVDGSDFTATNGTSITLSNSAVSGDEVVVISYSSFQVADHYNKTESDTRFINTAGDTLTGTLGGTAVNLSGDLSAVNTTLTGYLRGPASFTIDPATHADDTGLVIIAGNLQVDGSTTTINSTTLTVDDLNLTLASGAADSAAANGAGITIDGASASLLYSHSGTKFVLNKPLDVTGTATSTTGFTTGANTRVQASSGMLFLSGPSALVFENGAGSEKMRLTSTGLGIDTQVPTAVLDVVGPAARPTSLAEMDSASTARFRSDSSNAESLYIAEGASGAIIQVNDGATNSTTAKNLAIQPFGGNVGIGQTVPVNRLHVSGADGYAYLKLTSDSTGHTASDGSRIGLNGNDLRIINAEAASILFQTQNTERMRIASNGMVLVGGTTNTNGGSLLKVGGSGNDGEITLNSDTTASYIVSYDRTAGAYHPIISTASEHQLNGGNVGIGDTAPSSLLSISKNSTRTNDFENMLKITHSSSNTTVAGFGSAIYFVGERNNGALQGMGRLIFDAEVNSGTNISSGFSVQTATAGSPSEKFRITHDGNVGIGTSSPTSNYGTNLNVHSSATNGAALHLTDGTTGNSNNDGFHLISTGGLAYVWNREATDMVFATSNTEKMRIRPDGKTRIGGTDAITSQLTLGNVSDPDKITIWSDRTNGARAERTKYLSKTVRPLYNPNQYFRLNLGASSSGTGATVRYQATFSTGHAAGHGYCEGVATFYAHHSTSKQMSTGTSGNPHISYARMYGNGSYYGWTTYPDIRFYLCGATGNNATSGAAIYIQTSGHGNHNSSTYDLYTDIQLDLQVMNSDYNADPHLTAVGHATPSDIGAQLGCTFLS